MKGTGSCVEAGATTTSPNREIDQLLALMRVWLPEARKSSWRHLKGKGRKRFDGYTGCAT